MKRIPWNKGLKGAQKPWNKGLKQTPECRHRLSQALRAFYARGEKNWNAGRPWAAVVRTKISTSHRDRHRIGPVDARLCELGGGH